MIIEVALRFSDAEFSTQHRCRKILCARLAVASGDREDFDRKRSSIIGREILVSEQRVVRSNDSKVLRQSPFPGETDNRAGRAGFGDLLDKFVAIEILTAKSHEKLALPNGSRISADSFDRNALIALLELGAREIDNF